MVTLTYPLIVKPIDLLAKYINTSDDDMDIEMQEPYHLLRVSPCSLVMGVANYQLGSQYR